MSTSSVFINYRRSDTAAHAQNLHDRLTRAFGKAAVFLDVHDIQSGEIWQQTLRSSGQNAKVLLVLIGENWMQKNADGKPRLFDPGDWVRKEIELALDAGLTAVPVLLDGAELPKNTDIPESIRPLLDAQAINVRHDSYADDVNRLVRHIRPLLESGVSTFLRRNRKSLIITGLLMFVFAAFMLWPAKPAGIEPCEPFAAEAEVKTIIFPYGPVSTSELDKIDREFAIRCQSRFDNQINRYRGNEKLVSSGSRRLKAADCGADLFISPVTSEDTDLEINFGFVNSSLRHYAIDNDFNLDLVMDTVKYPPGQSSFTLEMDRAICLIAGFLKQQRGLVDEAISELRKCEYDDEDAYVCSLAYNLIADGYIEQSKHDSALVYLRQLDLTGELKPVWYEKVAAVARAADNKGAEIGVLTKLVEVNPKRSSVYLERRGDLYAELKDYKNASADYTKAKKIEPDNRKLKNKYNKIQNRIKLNNNIINQGVSQTTDAVKRLDLAERAIENGQWEKARDLLNHGTFSRDQQKRAETLVAESKIQEGKMIPASEITEEMKKINPRLKSTISVETWKMKKRD